MIKSISGNPVPLFYAIIYMYFHCMLLNWMSTFQGQEKLFPLDFLTSIDGDIH